MTTKRQRRTKSTREWRARDRAGDVLAPVVLTLPVLEWLLSIQWIDEADLWVGDRPTYADKVRVGRAVAKGLEASARAARK